MRARNHMCGACLPIRNGFLRNCGYIYILLALSACQPGDETPPADTNESTTTAPVSPDGSLRTRTFANDEVTLTLFKDFTFRLRHAMDSGAADQSFSYDLGRWSRAPDDGDRLRLLGGREAPTLFRFVALDLLQPLNNRGAELAATPLRLQMSIDPVNGPMRLTGMYRYMADAAVFSECLTGNSYPVLIEAVHLPLERAYLEQRGEPGAEVLAIFEAEFVLRAPEPGLPARENLRITRFEKLLPTQQCPQPAGAATSQ